MFLNHENIQNSFIKEGFGPNGQREAILVVKMNQNPMTMRLSNPDDYEDLSNKLAHLDHMAKHGFLDFNRIEIVTGEKSGTRTLH
jgi:hypothetical protein